MEKCQPGVCHVQIFYKKCMLSVKQTITSELGGESLQGTTAATDVTQSSCIYS